jgi:hypothetical protein
MIWYKIYEGDGVNDYDDAGESRSLKKAMGMAKKSTSAYVRVDKWEGEDYGTVNESGDYVETILERKAVAS